jgi:hypothetical protein
MVIALLVIITLLFIPIGLFYLGQGDAKTCGATSGFVGLVVLAGTIIMFVGGDAMNGMLFGSFGVLYLVIAYCILAGIEDLRSLGNVSLTVALICAIACWLFLTGGGVKPDGTAMIGKSLYLAFMTANYSILTAIVWAVTYGKLSAKILGLDAIFVAIVCLLVPAISLLGFGKLPF